VAVELSANIVDPGYQIIIANADEDYPVNPPTTLTMSSGALFGSAMPGELTYLGSNGACYKCDFSITSRLQSGDKQKIRFEVHRNNSPLLPSPKYFRQISQADGAETVAFSCLMTLNTNDILSIVVQNKSGTQDLNIFGFGIVATGAYC